jgi:Protein of unknown function (DUF2569)
MSETVPASSSIPKGIGGWLVFVILGLVAGSIQKVYFLVTGYWPMFSDGTWLQLTTVGAENYHELWGPLLIFEMFTHVGSVVLAAITLAFLVRRSRHTPSLAIAWIAWTSGSFIVDLLLVNLIPAVADGPLDLDTIRELLGRTAAAAIWIPYFLVSARVKATFVE